MPYTCMCHSGGGGSNGGNPECSCGHRDVLVIPFFHRERIAKVTWDFRFWLTRVAGMDFANPLLAGDTTTDTSGLLYRVDSRGVPGEVLPLTTDGVATERGKTNITIGYTSGVLIVLLTPAQLAAIEHGKSYIARMQQQARGHDEWSIPHDVIVTL
ncbi:MAG: hypothetical protein FWE88_09780 [Phycisphaerae bacterium]|nr:hypothetical protein [Phycisphaerae bacterium]